MIMKKILYSILAVTLAVSCVSFKEEMSKEILPVGEPSITQVDLGETSLTVKITAPENTSFYSYAVMAGEAAQLDSASLFKLGYKSNSVAYGTVDYSKTAETEVVAGSADKPLSRNADYTVYAVAANEQGTIGKVVSKTFHTGDSQIPSATSAKADGNVMTISFSEPVSYNSAKPVTAKYYAANLITLNEAKDALATTGEMGDAKATVAVADDQKSVAVTVTLADGNPLPDGAYYAVSYPAGAFKDAVDNEIKALASGPVAKEGKIAWSGAYAQIAKKAWSLTDDDAEAKTVAPSKTFFTYTIPEAVTLFKANDTAAASMKVVKESSAVSSEATYKLAYGAEWGIMSATQLIVMYPAAIDILGGDDLTVTIAEGSFEDIYGNTNEALTHEYLYSFGYKLADFTGTYTFAATSQYAGAQAEAEVIIAPNDDPEVENGLVIYNLFNSITCCDDLDTFTNLNTAFAATYNLDAGTIVVDYDAIGTGSVAQYSWENYVLALSFDTDDNSFSFQMPAVGTLVLQNVVAIYLNGLGTWDRYQTGTLTRTSEEYTVPSDEPAESMMRPGLNLKKRLSK